MNCAVFTPDGRRVVSCSAGEIERDTDEPGPVLGSDYSIRVWEWPTGREVQRITQHTAAINSVAVSPDGRFILSGSDDGTARLWDAKSGRELRRYEGHAQPVAGVAFSSSGRYALTGGYDRTVRVWEVAADRLHDLTRGRQLRCFEIEDRSVWGGGMPHDLAFSPNTRHVLAGCNDFLLRLWDTKSGKLLRLFEGHTERVFGVAYSADGRRVLSGSYDGTMRLWDTSSGKEVVRLGVDSSVTKVALSPDAGRALCSSLEKPAEVWNLSAGRLLCRLGQDVGGRTIGISTDGRFAIAAPSLVLQP